jgi:hypothetical protein
MHKLLVLYPEPAEGQAVGADVPNYATGGAVPLDYSVAEGSAARTG